MATRTNFLLLLLKAPVMAFAFITHLPVFAQQPQVFDADWVQIARLEPRQLAQGILNVRMDLKEYSRQDLTTTSGQYELLYDEVMGPCKRRPDHSQAYQLCTGASISMSFIDYLKSNRRICPDPHTGSCWKPALLEEQMREELFELVRKSRGQ